MTVFFRGFHAWRATSGAGNEGRSNTPIFVTLFETVESRPEGHRASPPDEQLLITPHRQPRATTYILPVGSHQKAYARVPNGAMATVLKFRRSKKFGATLFSSDFNFVTQGHDENKVQTNITDSPVPPFKGNFGTDFIAASGCCGLFVHY